MLKSDPIITYNHMQEDSHPSASASQNRMEMKNKVVLKFIAEELIIAMLLALIFYMI